MTHKSRTPQAKSHPNARWTQEQVTLLTELWNKGLSATAITKKLKGFSRNAVLGKVHRLRLPTRRKVTARKASAPRPPRPPRPHKPKTEPLRLPASFQLHSYESGEDAETAPLRQYGTSRASKADIRRGEARRTLENWQISNRSGGSIFDPGFR